jgi:uncharacterized coiled-coil protein SlyX
MIWDNIKRIIAGSKLLQFVLVFGAGLVIGALFYPTKHIETKTSQKYEQQITDLKTQQGQQVQTMQKQIDTVTQQNKKLTSQYQAKIASLTTQVQSLQSKKKTSYYKLVKPDGTVVIKSNTENDTDESDQVVTQVQQEYQQKITQLQTTMTQQHQQEISTLQKQWSDKEQQYQKTIASLQTSKVVDINQKNFGIDVGWLTDNTYFGDATYTLLGPIYVGIQVQAGSTNAFGGLIGLHF